MEKSPVAVGATVAIFWVTYCSAQTVPPSIDNCQLNSSSPFSWVVQIWDDIKELKNGRIGPGTAALGGLLTFKAVLTTAWYFYDASHPPAPKTDQQRYTVIGNRIWDFRDNGSHARTNPCFQSQRIKQIHYHPQALTSNAHRIFFDYAIIILERFFNVTLPTFPTMFFPNSPYELLLGIQYANVMNENECAMPITGAPPTKKGLVINDRIDFKNIKFHTQCVALICEQPGGATSKNCQTIFENRPNATMLCPKPAWTNKIPLAPNEKDIPIYYAGTPYSCNGTAYGLGSQIKRRSVFGYTTDKFDFFYVVTFLRIWQWLIKSLIDFSPRFTAFYIETAGLKREEFTEPYQEPLPGQTPKDFPKYPNFPFRGRSTGSALRKSTWFIFNSLFTHYYVKML